MTDDHDKIITIEVLVERFIVESQTDRNEIHVELGRLQQAVWQLQQEMAAARAGWKVMLALAGLVSAAVGAIVDFFAFRH